ncbi:hypothetical protein L2E82_32425 [Cichorium intybus]|uniref:Uncharacterized protein n=1 Tax=Cichorium intybus TaxID=13427 RepID=A0ACB9BGS5_CICIN|nr:hypothetical protein L2E82_32425 [Cichorium intybus]
MSIARSALHHHHCGGLKRHNTVVKGKENDRIQRGKESLTSPERFPAQHHSDSLLPSSALITHKQPLLPLLLSTTTQQQQPEDRKKTREGWKENILRIEPLNDEPEIFPELNINSEDPVHAPLDFTLDQTPYLLPDPSVDDLSGYNPFIDVPSMSSEIILMNQEFMTNIQNESQLQTTHNINIELNPEFGVGFQYQNHLQVIQRNLEGFQNPESMIENVQLPPIEATDFNESMSIFGSENQDHVQMIPNINSTFELNLPIPTTTVAGTRRGFKHSLSREIIAEHFNEPIEKAAKELNIGSTQLKSAGFGNEFSGAAGLSKDLLPNLKKEKEAIIEGSQSGLTDGTKKLIQAAHKVEYKKRKFLEKGETSSKTHTQQQSLPSNSGMSGINPGLLEPVSEGNFGGSAGNLAWFPPSYGYPQLVPNWNPSSSLPYLHTPQTSQFLAHNHRVTGSNPVETPQLEAPPPITESIPLPNPEEGTSQPNDDKEWSVEYLFWPPSDSSD